MTEPLTSDEYAEVRRNVMPRWSGAIPVELAHRLLATVDAERARAEKAEADLIDAWGDVQDEMTMRQRAEADRDPEWWECPDCAFTFDASHVNTDTGDQTCPNCAKTRLADERDAAYAVIRHWHKHCVITGARGGDMREWTDVDWADSGWTDAEVAAIRAAIEGTGDE